MNTISNTLNENYGIVTRTLATGKPGQFESTSIAIIDTDNLHMHIHVWEENNSPWMWVGCNTNKNFRSNKTNLIIKHEVASDIVNQMRRQTRRGNGYQRVTFSPDNGYKSGIGIAINMPGESIDKMGSMVLNFIKALRSLGFSEVANEIEVKLSDYKQLYMNS